MTSEFIINKNSVATEMHRLGSEIDQLLTEGEVIYISVNTKKQKRSLSANAQAHVWAKVIAEHTGNDIKSVTADLKLSHGLPIILADDVHGKKVDWMLKKIGFYGMSDKSQLAVMEYLPVTRLFSTKQHSAYRDSIQAKYQHEGLNIDYLIKS